jgi:hypothetical protein
MVVRGRGTPAGRDETPHSTGSLLAPPSRPERAHDTPAQWGAFLAIPYDVGARRPERRRGHPDRRRERRPERQRARIAPGSMAGSNQTRKFEIAISGRVIGYASDRDPALPA